jgi:hypothetical protein
MIVLQFLERQLIRQRFFRRRLDGRGGASGS